MERYFMRVKLSNGRLVIIDNATLPMVKEWFFNLLPYYTDDQQFYAFFSIEAFGVWTNG